MISSNSFITDAHIPMACIQFVQEIGAEVLAKKLRHNLLLHFVNLYDFSLIHPTVIIRAMAELDKIRKKMGTYAATASSSTISEWVESDLKVGDLTQEGQKKGVGEKSWYDMGESFEDFPSCSTTESAVTSENNTVANSGDSNV